MAYLVDCARYSAGRLSVAFGTAAMIAPMRPLADKYQLLVAFSCRQRASAVHGLSTGTRALS
jgi:hypothetical protein